MIELIIWLCALLSAGAPTTSSDPGTYTTQSTGDGDTSGETGNFPPKPTTPPPPPPPPAG